MSATDPGGSAPRTQPDARPTRHALTVEDIISVALEVVAGKSFGEITMRSVARGLGVTPMALYHHVKDKQDLINLVVDSLMADVEVPGPEVGGWQERLTVYQNDMGRLMDDYPGLDAVVFMTRGSTQARRLQQGYLQVMQEGGLTLEQALAGFRIVHAHAFGMSLLDRQISDVATHQDSSLVGGESDGARSTRIRALDDKESRAAHRRLATRVMIAGLSEIFAEATTEPRASDSGT